MKVLGIFAIVSVTLISVGLMQPVSSQAMCAGDKTLEDQYQEYDYIFSGKVAEIQPNPVRGKITLTVYEMWKGQPSESITILSGVGESDYSIPFEIGDNYLVFASKLVFDEPVTSGCSPTKPLINASNEIEFLNTKTESKTINFQYPVPGSSIVANLYSLKTQIEYGLSYDQLRCNEGHVLIQKYDGSPACVTESTKQKLIERKWTTGKQNTTIDEITIPKYGTPEFDTEYQKVRQIYLDVRKPMDLPFIGLSIDSAEKHVVIGINSDKLTENKDKTYYRQLVDELFKDVNLNIMIHYKNTTGMMFDE